MVALLFLTASVLSSLSYSGCADAIYFLEGGPNNALKDILCVVL